MEESDSSNQASSQSMSSTETEPEEALNQVTTKIGNFSKSNNLKSISISTDSESESKYEEKANLEIQNIKCTVCSCSISLEDILNSQVYSHPVLQTLLCETCFSRTQTVDETDKTLCLWCSLQEKDFMRCIDCRAIFCIKCLKTNQSTDMLDYIVKRKHWKCFVCVPTPLYNLQKICQRILNYVHETGTSDAELECRTNQENVLTMISELKLLCAQLHDIGDEFAAEFRNQMVTVGTVTRGYKYVLNLCDSIKTNVTVWESKCWDKLSELKVDLKTKPEETPTETQKIRGKLRNRSKLRLKPTKDTDSDSNEEEQIHYSDYIIYNKPGCTSRSQEMDVVESQTNVIVEHSRNQEIAIDESETNVIVKHVDTDNNYEVNDIESEKNIAELNNNHNDINDFVNEDVCENTKVEIIANEVGDGGKSSDGFNTDTSIKSGDSLFSVDTIALNPQQAIEDMDFETFQLPDSVSKDEDDKRDINNVIKGIKEVDQCFRLLSENDCDSISDSFSSDLNLSDANLSDASDTESPITNVSYHISNKLPELPKSGTESGSDSKSETQNIENSLKRCSVEVKELSSEIMDCLNVNGHVILSQTGDNVEDKEWKEINRLTNLDSLTNKRKNNSKSDRKQKKIKKLKRTSKDKKDTDSSSLTDSNSNSDNDNNMSLVGSPPALDIEIKWNEVLSDGVVIDSDSESDYLSDNNDKNKSKSPEKRKCSPVNDQDQDTELVVKKEKRTASNRSKWRNDAALRANLNDSGSSTDSTNDEDGESSKKKTKKSKISRDLDLPSTSKLSNDENDDFNSKMKSVENTANDLVNCSDSDSSIEFVKTYKNSRKVRTVKWESSDDSTDIERELTPKGRKNIRAIASDRSLNATTKRANILEINRNARLVKKNQLVESYMKTCGTTDNLILDIDENTKKPVITVHPVLTQNLKPHQKRGVRFMFDSCYESAKQVESYDPGTGCILAHSMGLGKTLQVVTLVHTLFAHPITNTKYVLVVCPLSIVLNWENEFKKGLRNLNDTVTINIFCISEQCDWQQKRQKIKTWEKKTGVLVMGYEAFCTLSTPKTAKRVNHLKSVRKMLIDPGPDLVVLDEGHLLKNGKAVRTKALMEIATQRRIILTGTPMQNNLSEYYYMINFVKPNLLGSYSEFTNRFVNPINNGQYHDSTEADIKQMKKRSHVLHALLNESVFQRYEAKELQNYLPKKYDYVLLIQLHPLQAQLYSQYLDIAKEETQKIETKLFCHFNNLQLICLHPYLLHLKEQCIKQKKEWSDSIPNKEVIEQPNNWWHSSCPEDFKTNIDYGPKYKIVLSIIRESEAVGDKVVIFSSSLVDLDAIESFLHRNATETSHWTANEDYYRMDGSVPPEKRLTMCHNFNNVKNKRTRVFLLSHRVGGLGINLVGANRLILMNVSWNPAWDNQSVFRLYRFGQTKRCYIYRLVCMGTMEEVIYGRQINKLAVFGRVIDKRQTQRHYRREEVQSMLKLTYQLDKPKLILRTPSDDLLTTLLHLHNEIYNFHEHQSLLENKPDEHLNTEEMSLAWEEFNKENEEREHRLQEAQKPKEANTSGQVPNNSNILMSEKYTNQVPISNSFSTSVNENLRNMLLTPSVPTNPFECVFLPNNNNSNIMPPNQNQLFSNTQINQNRAKTYIQPAPQTKGNRMINPAALENRPMPNQVNQFAYPQQQPRYRPNTLSSLQNLSRTYTPFGGNQQQKNVASNLIPNVRPPIVFSKDKVPTNQHGRAVESKSNDSDVVIIDDNLPQSIDQNRVLTDLSKNSEITVSALLAKTTTRLPLSKSVSKNCAGKWNVTTSS